MGNDPISIDEAAAGFNPAKLKMALGFRELEADEMDMQMLAGERVPTLAELREIADDLQFPVAFFLEPGQYAEPFHMKLPCQHCNGTGYQPTQEQP